MSKLTGRCVILVAPLSSDTVDTAADLQHIRRRVAIGLTVRGAAAACDGVLWVIDGPSASVAAEAINTLQSDHPGLCCLTATCTQQLERSATTRVCRYLLWTCRATMQQRRPNSMMQPPALASSMVSRSSLCALVKVFRAWNATLACTILRDLHVLIGDIQQTERSALRCAVCSHGVSDECLEQQYGQYQQFFAQPLEEKLHVKVRNASCHH